MVAFYKHDIPAWMDGTEALSDGAYRAYHVIVQLIYLNEGWIVLNEHGIAGRCRQSIRSFRANLQELYDTGKLVLEGGRLKNARAKKELEKIDENRLNARKGGQKSAEVRSYPPKLLEYHEPDQPPLQHGRSLIDKTRPSSPNGEALLFEEPQQPTAQEAPDARVYRRGREILGKSAGGQIKKLIASRDGNLNLAMAILETASTKHKPAEYVAAVINKSATAARELAEGSSIYSNSLT